MYVPINKKAPKQIYFANWLNLFQLYISKKVLGSSMDWNLGHIRVLKAINNSQGNTKAPSFKRLGKHIFNRIQ